MNFISHNNMPTFTIYPYYTGCWVFDDAKIGLKAESFVCGVSEMISALIASLAIPNAHNGFELNFSDTPIKGYQVNVHWERSECNGNWYYGKIADKIMHGWLCPALFKYFDKTPKIIYVKVAPLPAGVDPIWREFEQHTSYHFY